MKFLGFEITRDRPELAEKRAVQITQNATSEEILAFFGLNPAAMPIVTAQSALRVPAVLAATTFLSRTMATLDLGVWRASKDGPQEVGGRIQTIVRDAPNPEWSSYGARVFFWQQVFTQGRGMFAIVRDNGQPYELWPVNTEWTSVTLNAWGEKTYRVATMGPSPISRTFPAADIIDVPFMLAPNMVNVLSPIFLGQKAIQLALAMNDYGSSFFTGGGVPPLALEGPIASGPEAVKRGMDQIHRAIEGARSSDKPIFPMPPGHKLSQVGYDPQKGQMTEARLFQIQEIARVYQLPPAFLGDLSRATFSNAEQQDLHFVKHLVAQWAKAFEQEMNLKLFGQMNGRRYVRHDLDSLMRGDFLTRMQGLAAAVQGSVSTPNEARLGEGKPKHPNPAADDLFMQGATVPLGSQPTKVTPDEAGKTL